MAHAHDDAVFALRGDLQASRKGLAPRKQRMVTAHLKAIGQALKNALLAIDHRGGFAVHGVIQHTQLSAKRLNDTLEAEANAEHRNAFGRGKLYQSRHTEIRGPA